MNERYSEDQTKEVAEKLLSLITPEIDRATVVGLSGDLGAGKTTLTKAVAGVLGVKEVIHSPTFVIAKFYQADHGIFEQFVHIDAYRINSVDELEPLGWKEIISRPKTLLIIEWPERIKNALPKNTQYFSISHDGDHRKIIHG